MHMFPKKALFLFLLLPLFTLSACSSAPKSKTQTLKLSLGANPANLNPLLTTDTSSAAVSDLIFNGLLKVNEALQMVPDLAESVQISPDKKTYTFKLKRNVRWQDGTPFTATDVQFTFDKLMDPTTNTVRRSAYVLNGKPIRFRVIDPYTFEATLPEPYAPFLTTMGMGIIPKHLLQGKDINTDPFNQTPIGTGAFKLKKWQANSFILLERHPNYYDKLPKLDQILFKIIPDPNTALLALEKGEIDSAGVPPEEVDRIEKNPTLNTFKYYDLQYAYLGFNLRNPQLSDLKLRQAIAYAINRSQLVKGVLKGHGIPIDIPDSPVSWAYPTPAPSYYNYNPEKSKQLLAELGYQKNPETGFLEKNGQTLEFTIITNTDNRTRKQSAEVIQQYLEKVGIKVNIQLMEWSSMVKRLTAQENPKKFEMIMMGWSLGIDPDATLIWSSTEYPKGFNFGGFKNPTVDQLLWKGRTTLEQKDRKQIYQQIYSILGQELPYYFLYVPETILAVNKSVKGLAKPGPAGLFINIENIEIAK